jgi:hypothetical protein
VGALIGSALLFSVLGVQCGVPGSPFDGLPIGDGSFDGLPFDDADEIVDIELVNFTAYDVDPRIFIHPDDDVTFEELFRDENMLIVEPPLLPDELAVYTFDCDDVGTVASDFALLLLSPAEAIESDNGPVVFKDFDFWCGDMVSFIFIDDGVDFFTRVEVNGEFLTDY